jgi:hypothetical protein
VEWRIIKDDLVKKGFPFVKFLICKYRSDLVVFFFPVGRKIIVLPPSSRRRQLFTGQLHLYLQI